MAEFPAMPLWTDAYLGDTTHLSTIEHGAYLLLLIAMWRSKEGTLPNDDRLLARYARLTPAQWRRIKPVLWGFFTENGETISQGRLTDERNVVKRNSRQQSDKARARWLKTKGTGDAAAMPDGCRSDAPTPTPIEKEEANASSKKKSTQASRLPEGWRPSQALGRWAMSEFNWPVERVRYVADQFADYWLAASGQNARKRDWDAAFRVWCRKAAETHPQPRPPRGGPADDRLARKIARFSARPEECADSADGVAGGENRDPEGALLPLRVVGHGG